MTRTGIFLRDRGRVKNCTPNAIFVVASVIGLL
jgi:hypothetical protein